MSARHPARKMGKKMATVHVGDRVRYNRTKRDDYEGTVTVVTGTQFFVKYDEALNPNGTFTPYPLTILDREPMGNGRLVVEVIECAHSEDIWAELTTPEISENVHYAVGALAATTDVIADRINRVLRDNPGQRTETDFRNLLADILGTIYNLRQRIREENAKTTK